MLDTLTTPQDFIGNHLDLVVDNLNFQQTDRVLPGTNTELRVLVLGAVASLGGEAGKDETHTMLTGLDYGKIQSVRPSSSIIETASRTPDDIVTVADETITLQEGVGYYAVSLGGVLLEHLPRDQNIGLAKLVGGIRVVNGNDGLTGPSLRRMILNYVSASGKASNTDTVNSCHEVFGTSKSTLRTQTRNLIKAGIFTNVEGDLTVTKKYKGIISAYVELLATFETDPTLRESGLKYIAELMSGEHRDAALIPYMVKRSAVQSGRSKHYKLEEFIAELDELFNPGDVVNTTDIVNHLGRESREIYDNLQKMEIQYGETAPFIRTGSKATNGQSRSRRIWVKRNRLIAA